MPVRAYACVCVCVSERKTQREGEVMCVFQIWCHIMCLSGTVCVPGLPALFIPDSFVLVLTLTLCSSHHSCTCSGPGCEITNVFIHQNGNRPVCWFRKTVCHWFIFSAAHLSGEQNVTSSASSASFTEVHCFTNPMNIVLCTVISPVVMTACALWVESSQTGPDSKASRPDPSISLPTLPPPHLSQNRRDVLRQPNS